MQQRQQRWIDYTGLNLIRIVIGSYFMAIALGLIDSIDPRVLFLPFLGAQTADLVATMLLFSVTTAFMFGLCLRLTSLMLAIFILASSCVNNFMFTETIQIGEFWRDLTLVCAILLCYTCLKRKEVRKAALVWRRRSDRVSNKDFVTPRRVQATSTAKSDRSTSDAQYQASLEPLIRRSRPVVTKRENERGNAKTSYPVRPDETGRDEPRAAPRYVADIEDEEDIDNIFSVV